MGRNGEHLSALVGRDPEWWLKSQIWVSECVRYVMSFTLFFSVVGIAFKVLYFHLLWFMSVYERNHYNIVISLQLIKINEKNKKITLLLQYYILMIKDFMTMDKQEQVNKSPIIPFFFSSLFFLFFLFQYLYMLFGVLKQWYHKIYIYICLLIMYVP